LIFGSRFTISFTIRRFQSLPYWALMMRSRSRSRNFADSFRIDLGNGAREPLPQQESAMGIH